MIARNVQRLFRAPWTWRQPLTHLPIKLNMPISDLFVWRSSSEWQTYFELIDVPSLFEDFSISQCVTIIFFDANGIQILEHRVFLQANRKLTLNISSMISQAMGEIGTFAIFHLTTPLVVTNSGSFLAERGYVSYRYRDAPLRAFVHGNLDAISLKEDGGLQLLGGTSFIRRQYNLQHELQPRIVYEFGLVNPTADMQLCTFKLISVSSGKLIDTKDVKICSGGIQLVSVPGKEFGSARLIIESYLVMARPLVFRFQNLKLDVFHG